MFPGIDGNGRQPTCWVFGIEVGGEEDGIDLL